MGTVHPIGATIELSREERIALHNFTATISPANACGLKHVDMEALRYIDRVQRALDVKGFGGIVTAETRETVGHILVAEADLRWIIDRMTACGTWQGAIASLVVPLMDKLSAALETLRTRRTNGDVPEARAE